MAAILFCGANPFGQFWHRALGGAFVLIYFEYGPVVQEEMSFIEKLTDQDAIGRRLTETHINNYNCHSIYQYPSI